MELEGCQKRNRYEINDHHYKKELKKVKRISMQQTIRNGLLDNFNFKKTNAYKGVWSCSGYGGKCPSCKSSTNYGNGRKFTK
jgi:hypothetical protein